jgi:antitoxin (DNA-binding transcriptional repressor) of toxin-antitoxin stability system
MNPTSQTPTRPTNGRPAARISPQTQRLYRELMRSAYAELRQRAEAGEENVQRWLDRFLTLGEQPGDRS